jgi:N-acyl-D-amino-acid deacylase
MTGKITDRFQIKNRGYIKEGYAADITIFDYNDININFNDASSTPTGIKYVLVNGEVIIDNNQYTGKTNGKLLRFR